MKRSFSVAISAIIFSVAILFVSSCSYVTPEAENPNPGLEKQSTMYQVNDGILSLRKSVIGYEVSAEKRKVKNLRKTWLCGWAPVEQSGGMHGAGGLSYTPYRTRHCNMEMRISNDGRTLEARLINLNFPGQYDKWQLLFTIPILSHFFYEKDVDARGRELNKYTKVTDRSNWKYRPFMDLDLRSIRIQDMSRRIGTHVGSIGSTIAMVLGSALTDVYDIEISKTDDKQFIAWNGTIADTVYGSHIQHVYRFNFLEIKDNPKFQITPYNKRSAKKMNILHILGYQPDGWHSEDYAAHWDLTKPVEFCLNGWPNEPGRNYLPVAESVIEEMNKAMKKIGAVKKGQDAFVVSKKKYKYAFDLRCPSLTFVDDTIQSLWAPLGIGLVNTNIKTGEMLWGNAVIWGGLIDYLVNRDAEGAMDALIAETHKLAMADGVTRKHIPYFEDFANNIPLRDIPRFSNLKDFIKEYRSEYMNQHNKPLDLEQALKDLAEKGLNEEESSEQSLESLRTIVQNLKDVVNSQDHEKANFAEMVSQGALKLSADPEDASYSSVYSAYSGLDGEDFVTEVMSATGLYGQANFEGEETQALYDVQSDNVTLEQLEQYVARQLTDQSKPLDADNTFENHYASWTAAIMGDEANGIPSKTRMEKEEMAMSVIKNVSLHELGHVIGLGHQFEGNKMPEKGTVPDNVFARLEKERQEGVYYSSIMDYQSGNTEVNLPLDKVEIKIQDELTLRYLYKQEYPAYRPGIDKEFEYFSIKDNGLIPEVTPKGSDVYYTRYMPQCSDMDAWLATSPYCRRWDRGHSPASMVEENIAEFTDSFISNFNSFTEATGGNPYYANYRLWRKTYNLMNYNRTFYDNLRYQISVNETYRQVFDVVKKAEPAMLAFSEACIDPTKAPDDKLEVTDNNGQTVMADSKYWKKAFTKLAIHPLFNSRGVGRLDELQDQLKDSDYESFYKTFVNVLGDRNTSEMNSEEFDQLERDLNDKGLAFSEVQKLCRATKKSLGAAKYLLSFSGPDHPIMDYESAISSTGLRGGEARADYSRMFGTYNQLGLLSMKLAALDSLTNYASTLSYWWWDVPKPIYSDRNEGKYGYFSLYPKEFTEIIRTTVTNNMGFGGTDMQDAASMSISNLYMNWFLYRTFVWSNDGQRRGFDPDFIGDVKAQTNFKVDIAAILLEAIDVKGEEINKRFGFRPKIFNFAKRSLTDLPEAYVLPNKKVIVRGQEKEIIMPLTKLRFISQDSAYVWALQVTYDGTRHDDPLLPYSIKNSISELTTQELSRCIGGTKGLASFFNSNAEFDGFTIESNIAVDSEAQRRFDDSLKEAFAAYHSKRGIPKTEEGCGTQYQGIGLITSTALSLNGFFLPQVFEYINK